MIRDIVLIDEDKCDGCGLCVPACHEGAIQIRNGKAKVVADSLCDGMGACLGHCPRGAITIERREAPAFDEAAVQQHLARLQRQPVVARHMSQPAPRETAYGGCPGSRMQTFDRAPQSDSRPPARGCPGAPVVDSEPAAPSELTHWPVQLRLLPPTAPVLQGASLLIAADCVPVAYAGFQRNMLRGRAVLIGCPKFDDLPGYVERLRTIFTVNALREVVVARMEVPCCGGILSAVLEARRMAGAAVTVRDVVVGIRGELLQDREIPA